MTTKIDTKSTLHCSFCGKTQDEVKKFIVGPNAYICNECVELCYDIIEEEQIADPKKGGTDLMKPSEIVKYLDDYVVGQENAKRALAVAVYNHYKRILANEEYVTDVEIQKSNILLVGPTGVGKTFLAQTLARMLNVPFAIADATSLTEAGYVGEDVENILLRLIQTANGDIALAERGIIYVDEIDKISRKSDNPSITRDVSGEGVQQALLKILEGTVAAVPPQGGRKHPHQEFLQIDTTNILFICGGAFDGLDEIIDRRNNKMRIGFGTEQKSKIERSKEDSLKDLQTQDLHKYGLIPEMIGRLPVVVTLQHLNEKALVDILTLPKNALAKQYKFLFELDNVLLEFDEAAIFAIAKKALELGTGARGLRSIVESFMRDVMFEIPNDETIEKCIVTEKCVLEGATPVLIHNEHREPIVMKKRRVKNDDDAVRRNDAC